MGTLRRLLLTFLLAAGLLASAAGCGSNGSTGQADPARAAPADAAFYGEATIRPSGSLRDAVRSVARKVTLSPDPRAKLLKLIDRAGTRGASFERDIDPWLGSRAAAFVAGIGPGKPAAALIVGVRDDEKLSEALARNERRSGKGTQLRGSRRSSSRLGSACAPASISTATSWTGPGTPPSSSAARASAT